ncbi:MAG: cell division protein FtsB [Legionellales bacterium]|nr:cell division protein FtsB [Legionellales bacterium]
MKLVGIALIALLAVLQYKIWLAGDGVRESLQLNSQVKNAQMENQALNDRNQALSAEVLDLKHGEAAIEERARSELGMVKQGETFYQVVKH